MKIHLFFHLQRRKLSYFRYSSSLGWILISCSLGIISLYFAKSFVGMYIDWNLGGWAHGYGRPGGRVGKSIQLWGWRCAACHPLPLLLLPTRWNWQSVPRHEVFTLSILILLQLAFLFCSGSLPHWSSHTLFKFQGLFHSVFHKSFCILI